MKVFLLKWWRLMKMSRSGYCCEKCFWKIAKKNTTAAKLWLELCDDERDFDAIGLSQKDLTAIRRLEIMGFLVTTDLFNDILIKVTGRISTTHGTFYCGGQCQ